MSSTREKDETEETEGENPNRDMEPSGDPYERTELSRAKKDHSWIHRQTRMGNHHD